MANILWDISMLPCWKRKNYGVWTGKDYYLSRRRIFLSRSSRSRAAELLHSDGSLEAVDRRAPKNLINWQQMTEDNVSAQLSTLAPHGGEWSFSFLQAVGSTLVCYCRCTSAFFVNSSITTLPWTSCKDDFIQDPPYEKPSTSASAMAHEHRAWQVDCHQILFSVESRFHLWNHDDRVHARHFVGQCLHTECVIEWHTGRKSWSYGLGWDFVSWTIQFTSSSG